MAQMSRSLTPVSRVGVDERAAALGKRSIKTSAKREGIRIATSMLDLTTLEGSDTPGKVRHLCAKAVVPDPTRPEIPSCAAVCVYPALVPVAREAYLSGDDARVAREIEAVKAACGDAHLKVILETAELPTYAHVRHASQLAIDAGADFIKTSTGKAKTGATPGVVLVMLETVRDHAWRTGQIIGVKAAGGVSTTKQAMHMLVLVKETLGDEWLTPDRFRFGASSVLNDLLMQYAKLDSGHYGRSEDFSKE